jgi:5-methylcytosine-specific restriction endonuclease McrA
MIIHGDGSEVFLLGGIDMKPIPKPIHDYVWQRDGGRCRFCGLEGEHVHHIYSRYSQIPAHLKIQETINNNHPDNLILLCSKHHFRVHNGNIVYDKEKEIEISRQRAKLVKTTTKLIECLIKNKSKLAK